MSKALLKPYGLPVLLVLVCSGFESLVLLLYSTVLNLATPFQNLCELIVSSACSYCAYGSNAAAPPYTIVKVATRLPLQEPRLGPQLENVLYS